MNRLFFLLLFFIPLVFSCNSKKDKKISKKTEFKNGRWISTTDSLAGIEIKNGKWIMFYKGTETSSIYDFKTRREYIKEIGAELEYLTITSDIHGDSLEYAILEYSNELLSLSYIVRGNTLNYIPEKEKEEEKEATEKDSKDKDVNKLAGTDFLIDFSERWKEAYENINWSSDWSWGLEYGFRSKYKIANSILNQDTNIINVLSEIFTTPVFIRGPHLNGMNFGDKTSFGYYNPEFIEKLTVITNELLDNSIYKELLRPIYKNYLSEMAYAYRAAYEVFKSYKMNNPNRLEDATRNYLYQISIGDETGEDVFGVLSQLETHYPEQYDSYNLSGRGANIRDYYNFYTAINFWGRRDIDGTFEKIGELLNLVWNKLERDSYTLSKDKDVNNFPGTDSCYISTEGGSKIYNYDSYQITTTDLGYITGYADVFGEQIKIFYKDGESSELTIGNNEEILFGGVIQDYMIIKQGGMGDPGEDMFLVFDLKNQKYVFAGTTYYYEYKIVNSKIEFYEVIHLNYEESQKFTKPKCSSELDALSKQYPGSIGYVEKLIYDIATQQLERTGIYECAYFQ